MIHDASACIRRQDEPDVGRSRMSALQELWFSFFPRQFWMFLDVWQRLMGDVFPFSGCNEQTNEMTSLLMPVKQKIFTLHQVDTWGILW